MQLRQLPVFPTIVVLIAAGIMVWLGFWQLGRAEEKAELIARYEAAASDPEIVEWDGDPELTDDLLYRRVRVSCESVLADHGISGRSANGVAGWAQPTSCYLDSGAQVRMLLGWTKEPYVRPIEETTPDDRLLTLWQGGTATGILAPGPKLVADPPLGGLEPLAKPDPRDLPNNHLAYAGQWFFFALTALVIYWFAIKKRLAERRDEED